MRHLFAALMVGLLVACGGGGGSGGGTIGGGVGGGGSPPAPPPPAPPPPAPPAPPPPAGPQAPLTAVEAARLLSQATFGPTEATIEQVRSQGVTGWINAQLATPPPGQTHLQYILSVSDDGGGVESFYHSWWRQAITEPSQLRLRVAFALSQIFVISLADPIVDDDGAASYYDMLNRNAFSNFRTLLEEVTLHPQMGRYLTYLGNEKEDSGGTRTPDENYAREVMQLMTIGLVQLNPDGTPKLNSAGEPAPTYTPADVAGLAKVFTGISWYHPNPSDATFFGQNAHDDQHVRPMVFYPQFHSTSEKSFLGTTIPPRATPDVAGDLRVALDTLANHPNTGPFISQRLIQQLVTSNPSPAYVGRVASVFVNNGAGVRGDMAAVVRAILTDPEARDIATAGSGSYGKLREPVVRLAHWARAFGATSRSGRFLIPPTNLNTALSQAPLTASSVFNFWRPGFIPPGTTQLGQRGLLAPEFQAVDEVAVASYVNLMQATVSSGIGSDEGGAPDVNSSYAAEVQLADNPQSLVDRMNLLLFHGQMSDTLRGRISAAVNAVNIPAATGANQTQIATARLNRVRTAVFLSMISPEYLVQR